MALLDVEPALAAIVIFIAALLLNLVAAVARTSKATGVSSRKWELSAEIAELRKEAARLNAPATFAKCAKCQRQIATKEKELAGIESARPGGAVWQDKALKAISTAKWSSVALGLLAFYGEPLVYGDPAVLYPMHHMLAAPHGKVFSSFGAVAVVPWMIMSNKAAGMVAEAVVELVPAGPMAPSKRRPAAEEKKKEQ